MMSKLGCLLTICLVLFPLTALPLDGDQPAERPAKRTQDDIPNGQDPLIDRQINCCPWPCPDSCHYQCCH
uniref:M superfamily MMSK group conopeptide Vx3-HYQ01 n=1 Tax=Conus vexillum TaxID=89431 RepID=H2BKR3_CONVX|nr:M superfamily MMSK group conopeptide Vx3-HYQ01 [Conus vexillum]